MNWCRVATLLPLAPGPKTVIFQLLLLLLAVMDLYYSAICICFGLVLVHIKLASVTEVSCNNN